jgi:hypothetical protein
MHININSQGWARDLPRRDQDLGLRDRDVRDETETFPARDETLGMPRDGLKTETCHGPETQVVNCIASYLQHGQYENVKSYQVMTAQIFFI